MGLIKTRKRHIWRPILKKEVMEDMTLNDKRGNHWKMVSKYNKEGIYDNK